MSTIPVKIKKLRPNSVIPFHGSSAAAGYDAYACLDLCVEIPPHETRKIPTGIAVEIPDGYMMGVFARSGLATKKGLRPSNCVGVIDSDYRGEVIVALYNDSDSTQYVFNKDKVAQLIILPFYYWDIQEVEELSNTTRGAGGFGSTDGK